VSPTIALQEQPIRFALPLQGGEKLLAILQGIEPRPKESIKYRNRLGYTFTPIRER
jgi:hypothetical protein